MIYLQLITNLAVPNEISYFQNKDKNNVKTAIVNNFYYLCGLNFEFMTFLSGALLGLSLATVLGLGPAFFTLIQTSLSKGFKRALFFDAGVMLSDIVVVILMMMTSIRFDFNSGNRNVMLAGIAAGVIVIIFGIVTYKTKPERVVERSKRKNDDFAEVEKKLERHNPKFEETFEDKSKGTGWYIYLLKGLCINIVNPFIWFFWMTCVATASGIYNGDKHKLLFYFLGTFTTVLIIDLLKIIGAYSLKRFFTEERMKLFNHIIGIILITCGVILIGRVLFG